LFWLVEVEINLVYAPIVVHRTAPNPAGMATITGNSIIVKAGGEAFGSDLVDMLPTSHKAFIIGIDKAPEHMDI
jgi:hypothetical protein